MTDTNTFDLENFFPYLLSQAGDASSLEFQQYYKSKYRMLRTEWRVLFHLGRHGVMTAKEICNRSRGHKTKVGRAVLALEKKGFLTRATVAADRRQEHLHLTKAGRAAFADLTNAAQRFNANLVAAFTEEECATLRDCLVRIAQL